MPVEVEVRGEQEVKRKLEQAARDLHGDALIDGMHKAALVVENPAKRYAPVDTGHLRASITHEVRVEGLGGQTVLGVVGSKVVYAAAMEEGSRPHFPPPGALDAWAERHGTNGFLVARAISRRGTKARRFLGRAFEESKPKIVAILGEAVGGIVRKANQ